MPSTTAEARLRAKNQLTVPESIVDMLDARQGDLLVFEVNIHEPGTAIVRAIPRSFAGAMTGTYGTTDEVKAVLRGEHAAWDR